MKASGAWGLLLLLGCGIDRSLPQYMQDVPRSEGDAKRAGEEIRKELGAAVLFEQVEGYFLVASNDTPERFRQCKGTIGRVYQHLYDDFLTQKPEKPIRVYLFRDKESYEAYCKTAYEKAPTTPFGFYMARERKMVMNISTGTGTLAHELVHPLLAEDFPDVPSWFNEGFASLYEESRNRNGKLVGVVNWRLPGLQKAIKAGRAIAFKDLTGTTTEQFYGDDRGVNYATARYLCLWLQEQGMLARFYKVFKAGAKDDPTGLAALEKTTGRKLEEIEKAWLPWVAGLKYP